MYPEMKWIVALFEWINRIQTYSNSESKWNYMAQLKLFVDGGMKDSRIFIDAISSIITRGCDDYYCSTQTIHFLDERRKNFDTLIYDILDLPGRLNASTTSSPRRRYDYEYAERWLHSKRSKIEGNILISENNELEGMPYFSQSYQFDSFISALRITAKYGIADSKFFFVSEPQNGLRGFYAGLVNLAAFFANAMVESISLDSCDEIHLEKNASIGGYAASDACGQNGRDYGAEVCPIWQSFITCPVDTELEMQATISPTNEAPFLLDTPPPPLQCRSETNTSGCCFWGRGALSTRNVCNMGKLNFHIGKRAWDESRPATYPSIDFCGNPELICTHNKTMEIRWVVGMFEWIDRVQDYYDSKTDWGYREELYKFLDGGLNEIDDSFIESVNNIVGRGCHTYFCDSAVEMDHFLYGFERKMNFKNIIELVFDLPGVASSDQASAITEKSPTRRPTMWPSVKPTPITFYNMTTESQSPTLAPAKVVEGLNLPTNSPIERSDVTMFNGGGTHKINDDASSFKDESITQH